jgi:magnesium transporter
MLTVAADVCPALILRRRGVARRFGQAASMSIIAASLYRNGKRIGPVSLDQPVRCATDRSEFVWIGLFEPSEAELRQPQENYDLHPLAIEDALLAHQLPKLDIYGDQLFVVARPVHLADGQICYGETSVFVGETFIISVRHGSERAHSGLRQQLESAIDAALGRGSQALTQWIEDIK